MASRDHTTHVVDTDYVQAGNITKNKMQQNDDTMVTVVCITYNHEEFISDALDSFVNQQTSFKFKVFVGDDRSTDRTPDIIRQYANRFPEIIIPFIREENLGAQKNLIDLCERATSPFIAFCEGDDYWIDNKKLQKQFECMRANEKLRACGTRTLIDSPENWFQRTWYKPKKNKIIIPDSIPNFASEKTHFKNEELCNKQLIHTSTYFFRWDYDLVIPDWYFEGGTGDIPIFVLQTKNTEFIVLRDLTSVYRINDGGATAASNMTEYFIKTRTRNNIHFLMNWGFVNSKTNYWDQSIIDERINLETANYLRAIISTSNNELCAQFMEQYQQPFIHSLEKYIDCYNNERRIVSITSWDGYRVIFRDNGWIKLSSISVGASRLYLKIKSRTKKEC